MGMPPQNRGGEGPEKMNDKRACAGQGRVYIYAIYLFLSIYIYGDMEMEPIYTETHFKTEPIHTDTHFKTTSPKSDQDLKTENRLREHAGGGEKYNCIHKQGGRRPRKNER